MTLVRNENWSSESDGGWRGGYPDKIVVEFGLDLSVIDQRIIRDSSADQTAASRDQPLPADLATIFNDPRMENRRVDEFDAYSYYYAVNQSKVPNLKHRQAIAAALDRAGIIQVNGGKFAGDIGDGVIKPNLPQDFATEWPVGKRARPAHPGRRRPRVREAADRGVGRADADRRVPVRQHADP